MQFFSNPIRKIRNSSYSFDTHNIIYIYSFPWGYVKSPISCPKDLDHMDTLKKMTLIYYINDIMLVKLNTLETKLQIPSESIVNNPISYEVSIHSNLD